MTVRPNVNGTLHQVVRARETERAHLMVSKGNSLLPTNLSQHHCNEANVSLPVLSFIMYFGQTMVRRNLNGTLHQVVRVRATEGTHLMAITAVYVVL